MQSFQYIKPSPALAPYIRYYWILQDDADSPVSERTMPIGCIQMIFHKGSRLLLQNESRLQPQSFICGQSIGYTDVQSTGRLEMITVVFQPYTAKAFLRVPGHLLRGLHVATDEVEDVELCDLAKQVADTADNGICIRLIEQFFIRRLYSFDNYNLKRMSAVLHKIDEAAQVNIPQLSDIACLSNKQFGRVFADYVGTTPKEFLRIVRMQRALLMLQQQADVPFAQVAYECGFFDQSHMIKEFRLFSGYTPAEFLSVCAPYSDYFSEG